MYCYSRRGLNSGRLRAELQNVDKGRKQAPLSATLNGLVWGEAIRLLVDIDGFFPRNKSVGA